ncbi:MAG: DUF1015 domain-containing protein [Planctomycetota bacterium]|jgi:uncharacterized protein (DUF1015 family)
MEIKPFKAYRFDSAVVGDVGSCISPPYDVISPADQQRLYEKHEYNIVRIIKGKTAASDNDSNNQYTRAADYLNTWVDNGVLKQDPGEAIYAYIQNFQLAGRDFQRNSFVALARLEEFGEKVRPHEETLEEPKRDRLNLKRATVAKFGLVFMLYEDEQNVADKIIEQACRREPLIDFVDEQQVRHRLLAIADKGDIDGIAGMMTDKSCIVADGHHRYETALNYYKETGNPAAAYQITAFVNVRQQGLAILATHRLVGNLEDFRPADLITALSENFEISEYPFDSTETKVEARQKAFAQMKVECDADKIAFGIYAGDSSFYVSVLKDKQVMDSVAPNMSPPWRLLDVSVLHKLVLERLLGIGEKELAEGSNVEYVKDFGDAVDESIGKVDSGQKQVAFFISPTKMRQVHEVTAAGEKMPQKSTFFFPKMHTGLTINKL